MNDDKMNTVQIPADKLVDALFHAKQFEHHYATQESVDNLKESMAQRFEHVDKQFEQVDKRFEQVDKRFEQVDKQITELKSEVRTQFKHVNSKVDRLQWFIVASALAVIFKEQIFALFT